MWTSCALLLPPSPSRSSLHPSRLATTPTKPMLGRHWHFCRACVEWVITAIVLLSCDTRYGLVSFGCHPQYVSIPAMVPIIENIHIISHTFSVWTFFRVTLDCHIILNSYVLFILQKFVRQLYGYKKYVVVAASNILVSISMIERFHKICRMAWGEGGYQQIEQSTSLSNYARERVRGMNVRTIEVQVWVQLKKSLEKLWLKWGKD